MGIDKRKPVHFKVHYQLIGKPNKVTSDYLSKDRPELMRLLYKQEGVSTNKCEFMYIHLIEKDGTVTEVMSYERAKISATLPEPAKTTTVVDVVKEIVDKGRSHAFGRYTFKEAK